MIRTTALALLLAASFTASAADPVKPKADPAKGQPIAASVCVACHGADGNSPVPVNPNLAGQIPDYIYKQLTNFKAGADGNPPVRNNATMNGMVAALSDDDMRNLAAYFSQQKLHPDVAKDPKLVAEGQKLWRGGDLNRGIPACAGCHGPAGAGLPAMFPRLAGQHPDYTTAQLKAFRAGDRANDPSKMMQTIAAKLSDKDIQALSDYAAGLR